MVQFISSITPQLNWVAPLSQPIITNGNAEGKLDGILQAIASSRDPLEHNIDTVALDLRLLRDDHRNMVDRANKAEKTLSELQPTTVDLRAQVKSLLELVKYL